ncbi:unnamed protein product [Calypogeia fissa]
MAVDFSSFEQYDALRRANRLLFQGEYEPVWIINSEEFQLKEFMQYYPDFALPEPPKPAPPPPKPGPMLVRVPMCCPDCEERLEVHLKTLPGIEKVTVDWVENKIRWPASWPLSKYDSFLHSSDRVQRSDQEAYYEPGCKWHAWCSGINA